MVDLISSYNNKFYYQTYFDPTVHEHNYKSLPQVRHQPKTSIHPIQHATVNNVYPAIRSEKNPESIDFQPLKYQYRILSNNPKKAIQTTNLKTQNRPNVVLKTYNKEAKKISSSSYNKNKKSKYIRLSIECKNNITTCKSAYRKSSTNKSGNQEFNSSSQPIKNRYTSTNSKDWPIPRDFVPIFEHPSKNEWKENTNNIPVLSSYNNEFKTLGEKVPVTSEILDSSYLLKNLYRIQHKTLFRHDFINKSPSVHKYLVSNIRDSN